MNRRKLEKAAREWLADRLITEEQYEAILSRYTKQEKSYILIVLAAFLISTSIIVFIFSDWSKISELSKILALTIFMTSSYLLGNYYVQKAAGLDKNQKASAYQAIVGMSFVIIGYITFGASLLLIFTIYDLAFIPTWLFITWSLVGLALYLIYRNPYLFSLSLLVLLVGQVYYSLSFQEVNYLIFAICIIVFFHFVFHHGQTFMHITFSIALSLQLFLIAQYSFENVYWYLYLLLLLFTLSLILPKRLLKKQMLAISLISLLLYKGYELMLIQDPYLSEEISFQWSFYVFHGLLIFIVFFFLVIFRRKSLIHLVLFIPLYFIPRGDVLLLLSLFTYAVYWILQGVKKDRSKQLRLGIGSFILSVFYVLFQYEWEGIYKSLFLLVAGIFIIVISLSFERNKRKNRR